MSLLTFFLLAIPCSADKGAADKSAADKKLETARAANEAVDLKGLAAPGREPVKILLGMDPGVEMIAIDVTLRSKTDAGLTLSLDDFTLISRKDGQRSTPMRPAQIAGSGGLIVESRAPGASGGMMGPRRGPIWGGIPGIGGRPSRIGGDNDIPAGVADGEVRSSAAEEKPEENPLLAALRSRELTEGKVADESHGLLYFIFEGKHKVKDLELMYKTSGGVLTLDFQK